jgi:hypothetical protein
LVPSPVAGTASAEEAQITNFALLQFNDDSSAGDSAIMNQGGATLFNDTAGAGTAANLNLDGAQRQATVNNSSMAAALQA